jgi:hypothetical protein
VHDTVAATKDLFGQGVAGFVNAGLRGVLRLLEHDAAQSTAPHSKQPQPSAANTSTEPRVLSALAIAAMPADERASKHKLLLPRGDGSCLVFKEPVLPPDVLQHAAAVAGVPDGLARRWAQRHSVEVASALCTHALCEPPITLNVEFVTNAELQAQFSSSLLQPHSCGMGESAAKGATHAAIVEQYHSAPEGEDAAPIVLPITKRLADLPGSFVQDAASGVPVRFAASTLRQHKMELAGHDLVVDLCAGNGTKTRQLLGHFSKAGTILATDPDRPRFETLSRLPAELAGQAARGAAYVQPGRLNVQSFEGVKAMGPQASLVLLDVPCSNTGVLPRRPEARVRWLSRTQESRMIELQRTILKAGLSLLKPGGVLVFATCSLEEEENQAQVTWAQKQLGVQLLAMEATLPTGQPGEPAAHYRDASFAAVLVKAR